MLLCLKMLLTMGKLTSALDEVNFWANFSIALIIFIIVPNRLFFLLNKFDSLIYVINQNNQNKARDFCELCDTVSSFFIFARIGS